MKAPAFLVPWQAEEDVPAGHQHHVVRQILPLDLGLLHDDDVRLQDIEHGLGAVSIHDSCCDRGWSACLERPLLIPRRIPERVPERTRMST